MIKQLSQEKRAIVTAVLLIASFLALTSQTMMVTALPVIQQELHVSLTQVQWLTTGYILIIGIITPLSSNLYEKFTNRQLFLTTTGLFIVGTFFRQYFTIICNFTISQDFAGNCWRNYHVFSNDSASCYFPSRKTRYYSRNVRSSCRLRPSSRPHNCWDNFTFFQLALSIHFSFTTLHYSMVYWSDRFS